MSQTITVQAPPTNVYVQRVTPTVVTTHPVAQPVSVTPRPPPELERKPCQALGITQLVIGCLCVVIEIILVAIDSTESAYQGIWAGVFVSDS